jgi:hypothetical protein
MQRFLITAYGFRLLVFLLVFLISVPPCFAGWKVLKRAEIRNQQRDKLRIEVSSGVAVRAWLILGRKKSGDFVYKSPLYKIDKNDVHSLKSAKGLIVDKNSRYISWIISDKMKPLSRELLDLMQGNQIVFQYYLRDGTIIETEFNLAGAEKAIRAIINEQ